MFRDTPNITIRFQTAQLLNEKKDAFREVSKQRGILIDQPDTASFVEIKAMGSMDNDFKEFFIFCNCISHFHKFSSLLPTN